MSVIAPYRVHQSTLTVGTGSYSLNSPLVANNAFKTFYVNGATVPYMATDSVSNYEIGYGVLTIGSPDTLSRVSIVLSSSSNTAVSWPDTTVKDIIAWEGAGTTYPTLFSSSHTFDSTDWGKAFVYTSSSNATITFPLISGLPLGYSVEIYNTGSGTLTLALTSPDVYIGTGATTLTTGQRATMKALPGSGWVQFSNNSSNSGTFTNLTILTQLTGPSGNWTSDGLNNVSIGHTTAASGIFTNVQTPSINASGIGVIIAGPISQGTNGGYTTTGLNSLQGTGTSAANFYQISLQNLSATGSSDFVATASDGSDTIHYADFGMNGATSGTTPFTNAHAAYLYSVDSELDIGALGTNGVTNLYAGGGSTTPTQVGSITGTGLNSIAIGATTASTGAFTTLSASSTISGTGFSTYLASPPAIGGTVAAAITGTTGQFNTSLTVGTGTGTKTTTINGAASGSGAGAYLAIQNGSSNQILLGNVSAIAGGTYNGNALLQSAGALNIAANGGTIMGVFASTGFSISSGLANSVTLSGSATTPTIGTSAGNMVLGTQTSGIIQTGASTSIVIFGDNTNQTPSLFWNDAANGTDLKQWKSNVNSAAAWNLSAVNDTNSATTLAYQIARGTTYNIASHTWNTSTVAGTAVQGAQLNTSNFQVGDGTHISFLANSPGANNWVNYIAVSGNLTTTAPAVRAAGSDTDISLIVGAKGAGGLFVQTGGGTRNQFVVLDNASGANYVTVTSGATNALLATNGGGLLVNSQGNLLLRPGSGATFGLDIIATAGATNGIQIAGSNGGAPSITTSGGNLTLNATGSNVILLTGFAAQNYSKQVPSTGFSITIGAGVETLILDPTGALATGTITMPATPVDGQIIKISSSQNIVALTVNANTGQSIKNAPTALTVSLTGSFGFEFRYVLSNTTWYRVQ